MVDLQGFTSGTVPKGRIRGSCRTANGPQSDGRVGNYRADAEQGGQMTEMWGRLKDFQNGHPAESPLHPRRSLIQSPACEWTQGRPHIKNRRPIFDALPLHLQAFTIPANKLHLSEPDWTDLVQGMRCQRFVRG